MTGKLEDTKALPSIGEVSLGERTQETEAGKLFKKIEATSSKISQFTEHLENLKNYSREYPGKLWRPQRKDLDSLMRVHAKRRNGVMFDKTPNFRRATKDSRARAESVITAASKHRLRSITVEPLITQSTPKTPKLKLKSFDEVQSEQDSKLGLLLTCIDHDRSKKLSEKSVLLRQAPRFGVASKDLAAVRRAQERRRRKRQQENQKQQKIYTQAVLNLRYVGHELKDNVVNFLNSLKAYLETGEVLKASDVEVMLEEISQPLDEDSQKTVRAVIRQFGMSDQIGISY
jgi:hypothetical protein